MRKRYSKGLVAVLMAFALGRASPAHSASDPSAALIRIKCQLRDVAGGVGRAPDCKNLRGWVQGRLDWVSEGEVSRTGAFAALTI